MDDEDKATEARVAQAMVAVAERDDAAIGAAKAEAATNTLSGRIPSIRVIEKWAVVPRWPSAATLDIPIHWLGPWPTATADAKPPAGRH